MSIMNFAFLLVLILLLPFFPAQAYLDPGSGSLIIQVIIGSILGILVTLRVYFNKIKSLIFKKSHKNTKKKIDERK